MLENVILESPTYPNSLQGFALSNVLFGVASYAKNGDCPFPELIAPLSKHVQEFHQAHGKLIRLGVFYPAGSRLSKNTFDFASC